MEQILKDFATAISPALAQLVIALVGALVTMATVYIKEKWNVEKSKLSESQQYLLAMAVNNGVNSAQQIYGAAKEKNKEKLEYAFTVADTTMKQWGFVISSAVIYAAIEAQVGLNKGGAAKG